MPTSHHQRMALAFSILLLSSSIPPSSAEIIPDWEVNWDCVKSRCVLTIAGLLAALLATPAILYALGFTAAGIAGGSVAAWLMSWFGGAIQAGGVIAFLQALGAKGISYSLMLKLFSALGGSACTSCLKSRDVPKPTKGETSRNNEVPKPTKGETSRNNEAQPKCEDDHERCPELALKDPCDPALAKICQKSCGVCGNQRCKDDHKRCPELAQMGPCDPALAEICQKSCGVCGNKESGCKDKYDSCPELAQKGYCNQDLELICPKSCGVCGNKGPTKTKEEL